jgi:hypothetical protein
MIGIANITAAPTLTAVVKVHKIKGDRAHVEVITGTGGWSTPGKRFIANASIVGPILLTADRIENTAQALTA